LRLQLHFDVHRIGIIAIAPYLACFVVSVAAGLIADHCIRDGARTTLVRKVAHTLSQLIPAVAIVIAGYIADPWAVVAMLTIAVGLMGAVSASFAPNHLDFSAQYASITLAVANTVASLAGIAAPLVVGGIVNPPYDDMPHWRVAFMLSAVISVCGWAVYIAFGTSSKAEFDDGGGDQRKASTDESVDSAPDSSGGGGVSEQARLHRPDSPTSAIIPEAGVMGSEAALESDLRFRVTSADETKPLAPAGL
jgi:MFS family permease